MRRRRALFYRSLVPVPAVAARIPDTRGYTCVHYRAFGGSVDTANGQIFAATRNLAARFTTLIAAMPPGLPLFVASSSAEVTRSMLAAALRRGGGGAPAAVAVPGSAQADDADPRAVFVAEWLALGRCARLLGTAGSSFSEEAAVAAGIVKEDVTEEPAAAAGRTTAEPARVVEPSRRASATKSVTVVTPAADHFADYLAGSVRVGRARCSSGACRAVIAAAPTAAAPTAAPTAANAAATTHASGTTTPPTTAAATAPAASAAVPSTSTTSTAACGVGAAEEEDEQHARVAIDADARRDASASAAGGGGELASSAEGEELAIPTAAEEGRGAREVEGGGARKGVDEEHMHLQGWTGWTIGRDGAAAEAAPEVAPKAVAGAGTDSETRSRSRGRPEAAPEAAPGATPAHWESPMARYKRLNKPVGE